MKREKAPLGWPKAYRGIQEVLKGKNKIKRGYKKSPTLI